MAEGGEAKGRRKPSWLDNQQKLGILNPQIQNVSCAISPNTESTNILQEQYLASQILFLWH